MKPPSIPPDQRKIGFDLEKRFINWALARDDDWWEEGQGHISIWDVRVMLGFFKEENSHLLSQIKERWPKEIEQHGALREYSPYHNGYNEALEDCLSIVESVLGGKEI